MRLYYAPGACSLAVHIALVEVGAGFELVRVRRDKSLATGGSYLDVNPLGYVPAVALDDGTVLTEVAAVLAWIADAHPDRGLAPAPGTIARARFDGTLTFIATEIHKQFAPLFAPLPDDAKAWFRERLHARLAHLAPRLDHGGWAAGDGFTVADAYLWTTLTWAHLVAVELPPPAAAYLARLRPRPSITAAVAAESLKP